MSHARPHPLQRLNAIDRQRLLSPSSSSYTVTAAMSPPHLPQNRYRDVVPYDASLLPGPYLNASYLPAFSIEAEYTDPSFSPSPSPPPPQRRKEQELPTFVASQAPVPGTFGAFYHHLHAAGVRVLVNLTPEREGGRRKADRYYPTLSSTTTGLQNQQGGSTTTEGAATAEMEVEGYTVRCISERTAGEGMEDVVLRSLVLCPTTPASGSVVEEGEFSTDTATQASRSTERGGGRWKRFTHRKGRSNDSAVSSSSSSFSSSSAAVTAAGRERERREILQIHLTHWPDHGVLPAQDLEDLVSLIDRSWPATAVAAVEGSETTSTSSPSLPSSSSSQVPIWIHCSAGIGRTGTIIACLTALRLFRSGPSHAGRKATKAHDDDDEELATRLVAWMRCYRPGMVQTEPQFESIVAFIRKLRGGGK